MKHLQNSDSSQPQDDVTRALPHAVGPEKSVLSSILHNAGEFLPLAVELGVSIGSFYQPAHSTLFEVLLEQHAKGIEIELVSLVQKLLDRGLLDRVGGPAALTDLYNYAPSPGRFRNHVQTLKEKWQAREIIRASNDAIAAVYDSPEEISGALETMEKRVAEIRKSGGAGTTLAATLAERAFDFDRHPEKPIPLFTLAEMPLCTAGNITNIQSPPKAGKSAAVDAMLAAVMNGNRQGPDTLGFSAENPQGHALIHFDTEQSRFDADALIRRACRRARVDRPPAWFESYSLTDIDIRRRREALRHVMREATKTHGGIFAVMIDGIGDLCADPNDSEEAFDLVHELHTLAIRHHCTICTVLHENPGSESGKTRGHLGSQLERKAETNLRLQKDKDGITTVWAERARHCYLPKEQGPCFAWNPAERMHTSCGTAGEIKSAASRERMQTEAEAAFAGQESFRHADLLEAVSDAFEIKERAAKDRVRKWAAEGIIRKDTAGKYHLSNP